MAKLTPLQQLAEQHRVGITFKGWDGTPQTVSDETLIAVLTALGVPCATNDDVAASLRAAARAPCLRTLPAAVVIRDGDATTVPVTVPAGSSFTRPAWLSSASTNLSAVWSMIGKEPKWQGMIVLKSK